jgi:predicted enzyme related to lactoylglutathione lyase
MINLRVDDVPGMLKKAKAGGAKIIGDVSDEGYGVFGWFLDPEGVKIELWQDNS